MTFLVLLDLGIIYFFFILTHKELTHVSQHFHNIFVLNYNVNLYCRYKKIGKFCTHLQNLYNIYHFLCIILTTFMYLQCKLALQVQSKHIKIFKKKTKKQKTKKQKTKNKNKAQTNWHT